jgi:hypothetical protein
LAADSHRSREETRESNRVRISLCGYRRVAHRGDDTVLGGLQLLVEVDVLGFQRKEFGERLGHWLVAAANVETHGVL